MTDTEHTTTGSNEEEAINCTRKNDASLKSVNVYETMLKVIGV